MRRLVISQEMMLEAPDSIRNAYLKARHEGLVEGEAKGLRRGREEGRKEGREEGRQEGHQEGEEKGFLQAKMDSVLKLVRLRFQPGDFDYQAIQHNLETFDIALLDKSFEQSLQANSLDDVKTWLSSLKA